MIALIQVQLQYVLVDVPSRIQPIRRRRRRRRIDGFAGEASSASNVTVEIVSEVQLGSFVLGAGRVFSTRRTLPQRVAPEARQHLARPPRHSNDVAVVVAVVVVVVITVDDRVLDFFLSLS